MGRHAHSIRNAVALVACLSASLTFADDPTPDEAHTPLTSISKRESYVFASTRTGLFRASLETKKWERLKTPPEMPTNGTFARQPGKAAQVLYVTMRSQVEPRPRPGTRFGLYLSNDKGSTWELVSERDDFGATLLLPNGTLFAVTGDDGVNHGSHLLRSADMGKTWRDITGKAHGPFVGLEPDPKHPSLVRIHAGGLRSYTYEAEDESYAWKSPQMQSPLIGRRSGDDFFSRDSSSTNRFHTYAATLANYFPYDFGNQTQAQALEVVPLKSRFEFARGDKVVVPVRVVFHFDADTLWPGRRQAAAQGRPVPKLATPTEKFADQPGSTDFWGLRVESRGDQIEKYPAGRRTVTLTVEATPDGKTVSKRRQPAAVKYQVFNLSPTAPYEREIDLAQLADFSRPGDYRVQIIYDSGGHPSNDRAVWDGNFTSPVFTVVIRE